MRSSLTKINKQTGINDFIAAGEWLIQEGFTSRKKLVVNGGSASGLKRAIKSMGSNFGLALVVLFLLLASMAFLGLAKPV